MPQFSYYQQEQAPYQPPQPSRLRENRDSLLFFGLMLSREVLVILLTLLTGGITYAFSLFGIGISYLSGGVETSEQINLMICTILPMMLVIGVYAAARRVPMGMILPSRGVNAGTFLAGVGICMGLTLVGGYISNLITVVGQSLGISFTQPAMEAPLNSFAGIFYVINVVILPPILEETVFRGVSLHAFRKAGYAGSILLSALVFAVAHGNFNQFPTALCLGLGAAYFTLRFRNIWIGVVAHFLNNLIYVLFEYGARSGADQLYTYANIALTVVMLLGMLAGVLYLVSRYGNELVPSEQPVMGAAKKMFLNPTAIIWLGLYLIVMLTAVNFGVY